MKSRKLVLNLIFLILSAVMLVVLLWLNITHASNCAAECEDASYRTYQTGGDTIYTTDECAECLNAQTNKPQEQFEVNVTLKFNSINQSDLSDLIDSITMRYGDACKVSIRIDKIGQSENLTWESDSYTLEVPGSEQWWMLLNNSAITTPNIN